METDPAFTILAVAILALLCSGIAWVGSFLLPQGTRLRRNVRIAGQWMVLYCLTGIAVMSVWISGTP